MDGLLIDLRDMEILNQPFVLFMVSRGNTRKSSFSSFSSSSLWIINLFLEKLNTLYIIFRKQAYSWVGYIWLKYRDVEPLSLSSRIREMVSGVGVLPIAHKEQGRVSGNPRLSRNQKARMYHLVESSLHERISGNCF